MQRQVGVGRGVAQPVGCIVAARRLLPQGDHVRHAVRQAIGEQKVAGRPLIPRVPLMHRFEGGDRRLGLVAPLGRVEHRFGPTPADAAGGEVPLDTAGEGGAGLSRERRRVAFEEGGRRLRRSRGGQVVSGEARHVGIVGAPPQDLLRSR